MFDFSQTEFYLPVISLFGISSCFMNHGRAHIYADNSPCRTYLPGSKKCIETTTATEVQNSFTFF